jgi:hypothetical protein
MHQDHKQWLSDNDMWRCDVASWQKELQGAEASLEEITTALQHHGRALQAHASAVRLREQDLRAHEHALAEYEQGEPGEKLIALEPAHERESANHAQLAEAHEQLKLLHHHIVAQLAEMRKTITHTQSN